MRKVRKEVPTSIVDVNGGSGRCSSDPIEVTVSFTATRVFDLNSIVVTGDFLEPETIKDFIACKNITKKQLVQWLNENYKS